MGHVFWIKVFCIKNPCHGTVSHMVFENKFFDIYHKQRISLAMALTEGSMWFFIMAIRRSMGIRTYLLWTASLIHNFKGWFSSRSDRTLDDSKSRSRLTATNLTAGASFHSRLMFSTLQDGLAAAASFEAFEGMAHLGLRSLEPVPFFGSKSLQYIKFRPKLAWVWDDILRINLYIPVYFPKLVLFSICKFRKNEMKWNTFIPHMLAGHVTDKRLCHQWWPMFWFVPV